MGVGTTATNLVPSFGWLESFDDGNQHGGLPNGLLIATSGTNWYGYDPETGIRTNMNITNVPSGTNRLRSKGFYTTIFRYQLWKRNHTRLAYLAVELNKTNLFSGWNRPIRLVHYTINASNLSFTL